MSRPYLVRTGQRNALYLAKYKSCIKGHRVSTPKPGFYPSFGGALAWLRAHKKEIATAVNLLRMYPDSIEDASLNPVWSYLEPLLESRVQSPCPAGHHEWSSSRRRSKSAGDGTFASPFEDDRISKDSTNSKICKLPPLAATRYQAQFNSITGHTATGSNGKDMHKKTQTSIPIPISRQINVTNSPFAQQEQQHSTDCTDYSTSKRRQLFLLWRPEGNKLVRWPPQSAEQSTSSWCSSNEDGDCPFLPEHDILLNESLSSYSLDDADNWQTGSGGGSQCHQPSENIDLTNEHELPAGDIEYQSKVECSASSICTDCSVASPTSKRSASK